MSTIKMFHAEIFWSNLYMIFFFIFYVLNNFIFFGIEENMLNDALYHIYTMSGVDFRSFVVVWAISTLT